ncbi:MAG: hypothetical protein ACRELX_13035 [Longimicrobiales bacterium]
MMQVVRLTAADARLLAARFAEHGNSHRRMRCALEDAGAVALAERLSALRGLERSFGVDLGSVCQLHLRRDDPATHPIERGVIEYITATWQSEGGQEVLLLMDNLRRVRELMEGRLVPEPEP